jgi:hypothetical protein
MPRRRRNVTITSTALVAFALVAGCGAENAAGSAGPAPAASAAAVAPAGEDAAALLAGAPEATFAAGTARFEMKLDIAAQGQKASSTGSGSYDFAKHIGTMTMDGRAMGMPGTLEMIMEGSTVFMRLPERPGWYRTDSAAGAAASQQDPAKQLEMLRNASSDLRLVGTEQVRGAEARHIAFTLDPKKMMESLPREEANAAASMISGPVPADIWIDSEGRALKLQVRMSMQQGESNTTIEYFDFGTPVTIEVPDPADVQDLPTE